MVKKDMKKVEMKVGLASEKEEKYFLNIWFRHHFRYMEIDI